MTSAFASRVTRSSRSLRLAVAMFAGVLAIVTVLRAQEAPPPVPASAPAEDPSAVARPVDEPAAEAAEASAESEQPAAPAAAPTSAAPDTGRPVGPTPSRFEPTEKVRADFDVAFPIDI
jgi:hypothetical protein